MSHSWLPTKDTELQSFAHNFSTHATATPVAYGLVAGDATALAALVSDFDTKLSTATAPGTRTSVSIAAKDVSKAALIAELRLLYKKVNAANIAADKRQELGVPILDKTPTPIAAPTTKPVLTVLAASGQSCTLRAKDETTLESKAKPHGVEGKEVFFTILPSGSTPPADPRAWASAGISKKSDFTLSYDPGDVGKVVHLRASWFSPRGERGPLSDIVSAPIAA